MEVMMPSPPAELNMESGCTSPYVSAPSSPPRFVNNGTRTPFFSAPTSPTRSAAATGSPSAVPFHWEEKPGVPKTEDDDDDDDDFAFDFSGQLERASLPADELFDGGKIKPLKPPPPFDHHHHHHHHHNSPKSPRSPKKMFKQAFSPRKQSSKNRDFDPFSAALANTTQEDHLHERGREETRRSHNYNNKASTSSSSYSSSKQQKGSRSVSPLRVSDLLFDQETNKKPFSSFSPATWYRKWKLKDLLLFRSASEGRAASYAMLKKTNQEEEDVKNASFRSTESAGSVSSRRRRSSGPAGPVGPAVSAHELHYTMNRAASEEMKRKTFLPYKQGLLGCLGFNPTASHEISRGFASMNNQYR